MSSLQLQIKTRLWIALTFLALAALTGGCGSVQKITAIAGPSGNWYSVSAAQTPFYRYGPQQGNGPDQQLEKDSIMKVIRPSFGYVKVQLQDGQSGYVASEDIRPAAATLVAEKLTPPAPPDLPPPLVANHEEQFNLDTDDPRLIAPPEALPEPFPAESPAAPEEHP